MDCDEIETEATKTIGSTDIDKVLKKLKNKHTKESIILLEYIEKLQKEVDKKDKVIDLMAEQLTTPVHNKQWVIEYFEEKAK